MCQSPLLKLNFLHDNPNQYIFGTRTLAIFLLTVCVMQHVITSAVEFGPYENAAMF